MLKLQCVTAMGKCSTDVQFNYFLVPPLPCLASCLSAELWMRDAKLSAGIWPPCFSDWVLITLALSSWDGGFLGMSLLLLDMVGYVQLKNHKSRNFTFWKMLCFPLYFLLYLRIQVHFPNNCYYFSGINGYTSPENIR